MKYQELSDKQWNIIESHLPKHASTGRPRSDGRTTINGIIYVLIAGCRWSEMPKKYGDDSTANRRLNKWQQEGFGKKFFLQLVHLDCSQLISFLNILKKHLIGLKI